MNDRYQVQPALAKARTEHTLLASDDAMLWAEEFCRIFTGAIVTTKEMAEHYEGPLLVDEGTMVAWFANAMQVGINHYERRKLHEKGELTETEKFLKDWDEAEQWSDEPANEDVEEEPTLEESFLEGFQEGRKPGEKPVDSVEN